MAFDRPTLTQIIDRVKSDLRTALGLQTILRRSFEAVIVRAISGAVHSLYGFLDFVSKQVFPDTAEAEFLERWATIWGITRRAATFEQMTVIFTGTAGEEVPDGTEIQLPNGSIFTTDDAGTIATPVEPVEQQATITCVADVAGSLNNKYFLFSTPGEDYYVWINVNAAGVDPAVADRTAIECAVATGAADTAVATAVQTAMNAVTDITASVLSNVVTAICDTEGAADAPADSVGASTGFAFAVTVAGVDEVLEQVIIECTASAAGMDSEVDPGDILTLVSPVAGIDSSCTVDAGITDSTDTETDENLRSRLLLRIQQPPLGGSATDYVQETLEVAGVTRAWVFPQWLGAGTVGVAFVLDDEDDIFPDGAKIDEVEEALEAFRPVTASLTVFAPVAYPINPTIEISPNTAAVREAVEAELNDMLLNDAQVRGAYENATTTYDGVILLSRLNEAISIAAGEDDHNIVTPTADVTPNADGKLVTLGTITWQTL